LNNFCSQPETPWKLQNSSTCHISCYLVIQTSSPSAVISGFQPIAQTNKWCYIFCQKRSTRFVHNIAWLVMLCQWRYDGQNLFDF